MKKMKNAMQKDLVREEIELTYKERVEEYVKANNAMFLDRFAILCSKSSRISYQEMAEFLGSDFPMLLPYGSVDIKIQIVLFFKQLGLPFLADETHLYFV